MSDTPTRYDDRDGMKVRNGGDYVEYDDYEKLEQRLAKALEQRDRAMGLLVWADNEDQMSEDDDHVLPPRWRKLLEKLLNEIAKEKEAK